MIDALLVRYCPVPAHAEAFDRTAGRLAGMTAVNLMVRDNTRDNIGLTRARNRLLSRSCADAVALMDFDIAWNHLDLDGMGERALAEGVGAVVPDDELGGRGCHCMVVGRDLLTRMGGLDERYFVAYADWDLLTRMAVGGLGIVVDRESRITAHAGLSGDLPGKRAVWDRDRAAYRAVWGEGRWH